MKHVIALSVIILALILTMGYAGDQPEEIAKLKAEIARLKAFVGPPPSSLDALLPPKSEKPVYFFKMLGMATPFTGTIVDLNENDLQNAKANFENFKAQYIEVSKLVPEWEENFPLEPVENFGTALETGDQEKIMPAFGQVAQVCHACHIVNMVKVQQKYHWPNFNTIKVKDPRTDELVVFKHLMQNLVLHFDGIDIDVAQGQRENAQKQFQGFNAQFQMLKNACVGCHGTEEKKEDYERKYFVDESVQAKVDALGNALNEVSIDPKVVQKLSGGIGRASCGGCHRVHLPAAYANERWKEMAKTEKQ
jgi:cytochrome c553